MFTATHQRSRKTLLPRVFTIFFISEMFIFISEWLLSRGFENDFENLDNRELDKRLERFYAVIRNAEGQNYSKSTFYWLQSSTNRFLRAPPNSKKVCLKSNPDIEA